jgi:hypothetical protein
MSDFDNVPPGVLAMPTRLSNECAHFQNWHETDIAIATVDVCFVG